MVFNHDNISSLIVSAIPRPANPSGGPILKAYEVPASVLLDPDHWSIENNMLTVTGKPRRDRVRLKFMREMQDSYAALTLGDKLSVVSFADTPVTHPHFHHT